MKFSVAYFYYFKIGKYFIKQLKKKTLNMLRSFSMQLLQFDFFIFVPSAKISKSKTTQPIPAMRLLPDVLVKKSWKCCLLVTTSAFILN